MISGDRYNHKCDDKRVQKCTKEQRVNVCYRTMSELLREIYTWSTFVYSCHVLNKIASKVYPSQFKHPFQTTFNEKIRLLRIYTNYYWYRLTFMSKNIPVNKLNFITKKQETSWNWHIFIKVFVCFEKFLNHPNIETFAFSL